MANVLTAFANDEGPAIEQLRDLLGGQAARCLDGTTSSLQTLDEFIATLTAEPGWAESPLLESLRNPRSWLALRVGYCLASVLRRTYGCEWDLSREAPGTPNKTPVMRVRDLELSPLEIGLACVDGGVQGGLAGLMADLEAELRESRSRS